MGDRPHPDTPPPSQRTQPAERYGSDVDGGDDSYLLVFERSSSWAALVAAKGNQTRAAELIRMPVRTFIAKVKHYGLAGATAGRAGPRSEGGA